MLRRTIATLLLLQGFFLFSIGVVPRTELIFTSVSERAAYFVSHSELPEVQRALANWKAAIVIAGLVYMVAGWGALREKRWGRWLGLLTSLLNLFVYPYLTPVGVAGGLAFLSDRGSRSEPDTITHDRIHPAWRVLSAGAGLIAILLFARALTRFGGVIGLPLDNAAIPLPLFVIAQFVFSVLHETGHALAARIVGFRVRTLQVGPFRLTRLSGRWKAEFSLDSLRWADTYNRWVPRETGDLRLNILIILLAGPAATLLLGLTGLLVLILLPNTAMSAHWGLVMLVTSVCLGDTVLHLIPLGHLDGAHILHTVLFTPRGKRILRQLEGNHHWERGQDAAEPGDRQRELLAAERLLRDGSHWEEWMGALLLDAAEASVEAGDRKQAESLIQRAGSALRQGKDATGILQLRYWIAVCDQESQAGEVGGAAAAREKVFECEECLQEEHGRRDEFLALCLESARLRMDSGDTAGAKSRLEALRQKFPARESAACQLGYLLGLSAECALRTGNGELGRKDLALALRVLREISSEQHAAAARILRRLAERLAQGGHAAESLPFHAEAANRLTTTGALRAATAVRTSWARALYLVGEFETAGEVLSTIYPNQADPEWGLLQLQAHLLLAQGQAEQAVHVLDQGAGSCGPAQLALQSWAQYAAGHHLEAIETARRACDLLIPAESPDAAPALLTIAASVWTQNPALAEAYVEECNRLIGSAERLSAAEKRLRVQTLTADLRGAGMEAIAGRINRVG